MATMMSLGAYAKARNVNKGTVHRCAEKLGIDTSQGLSGDAISRLEAEYDTFRPQISATAETPIETGVTAVTVESQASDFLPGSSLKPLDKHLAFSPANFLGRTNGTAHAVAAMDQVSDIAIKLRQGIQHAVAQAQHEYEQVSDAAQGAQDQLRELELVIAESRAVTTVLEIHKRQSLKNGIEAQSKIERMMNDEQATGR